MVRLKSGLTSMDSLGYLVRKLNSQNKSSRLEAVAAIAKLIKKGKISRRESREVNNHVHTIYSFSPYSPSSAAYFAWKSGLQSIGIMDHDSIAGCEEMILACKILGLASTAGCEIRVNFNQTRLEGRQLNSPDSKNIAYIAIHGISQRQFERTRVFLEPINQRRNHRNRLMVEQLNQWIMDYDMDRIDYQKDIFSASHAAEGGSITERHILFALAEKILKKTGKGEELVRFLERQLKIVIPEKIRNDLMDENNSNIRYDLLGILKSSTMEKIYLQPDNQECISVFEALRFANSIDAIPAYAYLGDVLESPTGDKKNQKFEDDYLEELFAVITKIGFKAVTYMPPRNTMQQLQRIQRLCCQHHLMEISGVDINHPRQSLNCPEILKPRFRHLIDMTWALIAHEKLSQFHSVYALFHEENPLRNLTLADRLQVYSTIGREIDPSNPDKVEHLIHF